MLFILMSIFKTLFVLPIFSFLLVFDKEKSEKSIVLFCLLSILFLPVLSVVGDLNGVELTSEVFKELYLINLLKNLIPSIISIIFIIKFNLCDKFWFSRIFPWIGGIMVIFSIIASILTLS